MTEMVNLKNRYEYEGKTPFCMTHETELLTKRGQIVMALIERWGMVAAKPEGEDSAGRSILVLMEPEEMVDRAIETVNIAFDKLSSDERMMLTGPSWDELKSAVEDKEKADCDTVI